MPQDEPSNATAQFADEAGRFARWAIAGTDTGGQAVRNALVRLTTLYLRGLDLPPRGPGDGIGVDVFRVDNDEWESVFKNAGRLPLDFYGVVFDSTKVPPDEPVIGSVSDDIADVYRDVVLGLRLYEAGRHDQAVWEWTFSLSSHWGRHATNAIRAIHDWMAGNEDWAFSATP